MKTHYLQFEDIVLINEMSIEQHGGNFVPPHNFLHKEALHYVLESVSAEMFGEPLYPTIPDKAAIYMFSIISNHIFSDGNKRTGLEAALLFLRINNWFVRAADFSQDAVLGFGQDVPLGFLHHNDLYNFTIAVASGQHDLAAVRTWFAAHAVARQ